MKSAAADNEVVKLVNKIIVDAYHQGASDIHVEPYPGKGKTEIRFRKDGMLQPYISVPHGYRNAIAARIKIMCDLDISERRKPQDGKIQFKKFGPLDIELARREHALAGRARGHRDADPGRRRADADRQAGAVQAQPRRMQGRDRQAVRSLLRLRPTGSARPRRCTRSSRTSTRPPRRSGRLKTRSKSPSAACAGADESQGGLTFAVAMRAFLRCDPDIIMVGEMRDKETVATGIEASLTGHLVFATLHTNSAPESIVRLLDMGMDPFNFADALLGILAQAPCAPPVHELQEAARGEPRPRSARAGRVLARAHRDGDVEEEPRPGAGNALQGLAAGVRRREGGDHALHRSRLRGLQRHRVQGPRRPARALVGTDTIKKNVQEHARVAEMFATAVEEGMRTLKQDGIEKVLTGVTDIHQVRSVCIK
jgi:type II secretory ATPase GspE/PulE/Tfp pilus assembly ATPase PilB-like protein